MIADDILRQGVQGITDLLRITGDMNIDFADIRNAMTDKGVAHLGVGRASGENRAEDAAKLAIQSPLLETTIDGARFVIYNVTGRDVSLNEFTSASDLIKQGADANAEIIMGMVQDDNAGDDIIVTIIATGFEEEVPVIEEEETKIEEPMYGTFRETRKTPLYSNSIFPGSRVESHLDSTSSSSLGEIELPNWVKNNGK